MNALHFAVGAAEANRSFSKLLRQVREGARVTITSHGEPVAELASPTNGSDGRREEAQRALNVLEAHWAAHPPVIGKPWKRDDLYDYLDR
ncbi:MAG: type II toxin-antitoxin system prevent-host-death family antitoxin [Caulobacteraceae bacterium]